MMVPKITKLGLSNLEIQDIIFNTKVFLEEATDANGGAEVRKMLDDGFHNKKEWEKKVTGGIDWVKSVKYKEHSGKIGVEIQVSARSDLLIRDLTYPK